MICWSYGGGVQSAAIGVLIRQGHLPVPDLAVIADTGREKRTTWEYLFGVMQPYLDPTGLKIEVAPHTLATVDLYAKNGDLLMPVYTDEGMLPGFCSNEWKRRVAYRWLRLKGVEKCDCWIGYSIDELHRVPKNDARQWCRNEFPLIDLMTNRAMCIGLIQEAGLPVPQKSRCWGCPYQSAAEWLEVKADPEEWAKAVALDQHIRANDPDGHGDLFLYRGRVPLPLANLEADAKTSTTFRPCEGGHCWT